MRHKAIRTILVASALLLTAGGAATAAEPAACREVRFGDPGWSDIAATTALASVTLEGLGYRTTTNVSSVPVVYLGMKTKSLDIFLGNWMPTMESIRKPFVDDGDVEVVKPNLEGAKYTLAVPRYAADAGLKTFTDIAKFKDKLDGRILGIEAGNDGNLVIEKMIEADAFGLKDFKLVESSEAGMIGEVKRAIRSERWVVFLGWAPHPMNKNFDMVYLAGGDEYFGPDFGGATVYTNVRKGYLQECPNVGQFLKNVTFTLDMENTVMDSIDRKMKPEEAAADYLKKNPEILKGWLAGVTSVDGRDGFAAV
jgi:glycine betaine/proline transport system substrate-binding protein